MCKRYKLSKGFRPIGSDASHYERFCSFIIGTRLQISVSKKRTDGFRKLWQNFINIVVPRGVISLFSFIFYLLIILLTLYGKCSVFKSNNLSLKADCSLSIFLVVEPLSIFFSVYEEQGLNEIYCHPFYT